MSGWMIWANLIHISLIISIKLAMVGFQSTLPVWLGLNDKESISSFISGGSCANGVACAPGTVAAPLGLMCNAEFECVCNLAAFLVEDNGACVNTIGKTHSCSLRKEMLKITQILRLLIDKFWFVKYVLINFQKFMNP